MENDATVYVVDDDDAVRNSLVWLLESVNLQTFAYASARDFLDDLVDDKPACIVTDLRMSGMSGLELQNELNNRQIKIPVIIMTAFGEVATAIKSMKYGAVDFVEKPFNNHEMLDLINLSLEADRLRRENEARSLEMVERIAGLTPKEHQVFERVAQGLANKSIADAMGISIKTVEAHRANVMQKLEAKSVAELVKVYLENNS